MPPFVDDVVPLSGAPTLVNNYQHETPFSQAIDQFLAELKEGDDAKNPFIKEIRATHQLMIKAGGGDDKLQSQVAASDLKNFVQGLEEQKKSHMTHRILQRLTPFIDNLSKLMGMCEELLQASPFGVSIAFTGARIVLALAVQVSNGFDSIVDGIEEIGTSLKCYEKFAEAYRTSTDIHELLVNSYKRVIQFWSNVSRILSTNKLKVAVKSLVIPIDKEVTKALNGLKRDGERVSILAQATTAQQMQRDKEAMRRTGIINWITSNSPVDIRVNLKEQVALHQEGTCQWLLDDARFKDWCTSHENSVIWYHAHPGSGKTILASTVIEHLTNQGQNVAYFFYSFNSPSRKKGISGLRSLALQLFRMAKFVPQTLQDRFDTELGHNVEGLYDQSTAVQTVHDLLKHECADICIVVDGLDECSDEAETMMNYKNLLGMDTYGVVKWFFTSRNHPQIRNVMEKCKAREIQAETDDISKDIRTYFSSFISCKTCINEWSEGEDNFLYARLICEKLRGEGLTSDEEIERALKTFPKDLNGYYIRALEMLSEKSEEEQEKARRTFMFLVSAAQSVSLNELLDFLAISPGAKDYDKKRIPFIKTIRDLCSPLIIFDKPGKGDDKDNPLLKLCHKTVEDFFLQNPDEIDLGSTKLRKYFVKTRQANENIGLDCLTYLQYERYQKPNITHILDSILTKPTPRDHAFLSYAATFWAQHLDEISPSPEAYGAVEQFLKSPAFWTCLAIQTRIGRYLFGRYMGCKSSSQYKMGIKGSRLRGDDCFGIPLPQWLDRYSQEGMMLDRSMCYFVDEWREVIVTCTGGLQSCLPLRLCEMNCHLTPLEKPKHVRVAHIAEHLPKTRSIGGCRLLGVNFVGKTLWADLLFQNGEHKEQLQHLCIPLFSKKKTISTVYDHLPMSQDTNNCLVSLTGSGIGTSKTLETWKVDLETLCIHRALGNHSERHEAPLELSEKGSGRRKGKWGIMSVQDVGSDQVVTGAPPLQIVHVAWIEPQEVFLKQGRIITKTETEESDDDTDTSEDEDEDSQTSISLAKSSADEDSDDDSDHDSDDDSKLDSDRVRESSSGTESSATEYSQDKDDLDITDCLLLVPPGGSKPFWHSWSTTRQIWSRVQCASHPTLPLVVITHTARQLEIIDTMKWTKKTNHLPEPNDLRDAPLASVRELRFSACAKYLHLLCISFYPEKACTVAQITISTFSFNPEGDRDNTLLRESQARCYKYKFGESLAEIPLPLSLTHWSDQEVIVALPPLTCDPKVIKFTLPQPTHSRDDVLLLDIPISTLHAPIYFPTSTPRRNARLMYRSSQGIDDSDYIFLALGTCTSNVFTTTGTGSEDSKKVPDVEEGDTEETGTVLDSSQIGFPVVLRWKVAEVGGWRAWTPNQDEMASDLKRGMSVHQMLKGEFVDNDKNFSVPIRSGLDWTRKGYLSCSTF